MFKGLILAILICIKFPLQAETENETSKLDQEMKINENISIKNCQVRQEESASFPGNKIFYLLNKHWKTIAESIARGSMVNSWDGWSDSGTDLSCEQELQFLNKKIFVGQFIPGSFYHSFFENDIKKTGGNNIITSLVNNWSNRLPLKTYDLLKKNNIKLKEEDWETPMLLRRSINSFIAKDDFDHYVKNVMKNGFIDSRYSSPFLKGIEPYKIGTSNKALWFKLNKKNQNYDTYKFRCMKKGCLLDFEKPEQLLDYEIIQDLKSYHYDDTSQTVEITQSHYAVVEANAGAGEMLVHYKDFVHENDTFSIFIYSIRDLKSFSIHLNK